MGVAALFFPPLYGQGRESELRPDRIRFPLADSGDSPVLSQVAVGDLMIGHRVLPFLEHRGSEYPFDSTRAVIQAADIAFANLEAPFTSAGVPFDKKYTFRVPPGYAAGLKRAGFDLLTLANNHILDYGPEGLVTTLDALDSLGLAHCGAGFHRDDAESGCVVEKAGWNVGFVAYSLTYPAEFWASPDRPGTAFPEEGRLRSQIRRLKERADIVVVSFHWGGERMNSPKPYQRRFAYIAVESGADLVVGHHPHVLQGLELYKGSLIAYSLGNYAFGSYNRRCRDSAILKVWFDRRGFLLAEVIPINVNNFQVHFQPRVMRGHDRTRVIKALQRYSLRLNHGTQVLSASGLILSR